MTANRTYMDAVRVMTTVRALMADYPELVEDETLRADMLEGATDLHAVLASLVQQIAEHDANARALGELRKLYQSKAAREGKREEAKRDLILRLMVAADLPRVVLPDGLGTLTVSMARPSVEFTGEVGPEWRRPGDPDKTRIRDALTAGEEVPGAHLSNGRPTLTIRG